MSVRIEINKEAFAKLAEDPLFAGTVEEHAKRMIAKANEKITNHREKCKLVLDGTFKYKHGGSGHEAKELFGTEWRTMERRRCSFCKMVTLVDDSIQYSYCPHCGAEIIKPRTLETILADVRDGKIETGNAVDEIYELMENETN